MPTALKYAVAAGGIAFLVGSMLMALAISDSASSTAAIGYLFLPFYAAVLWGAPASLGGFCLGYLRSTTAPATTGPKVARLAAWAILVALIGGTVGFFAQGFLVASRVQDALHLGPEGLDALFDSGFLGKNKFVLGGIAQNKRASAQLLHKIALLEDPALHEAMGSLYFDVSGEDRHGLAVMRWVARNPNVGADTLELLAKSPVGYVRSDAAAFRALRTPPSGHGP